MRIGWEFTCDRIVNGSMISIHNPQLRQPGGMCTDRKKYLQIFDRGGVLGKMRVFVLLKEISYFENAKPSTETTKEINVSDNWKRFQLYKVNKNCENDTF